MKLQLLILLFFTASFSFAQSMILKGHIINNKTKEPIANAKVYIVGGDSEDQTTTFGEYRLDLTKGASYNIGDEIDIYVKHDVHGFHKERVPILKSLNHDIIIEPDHMRKITGTILDIGTEQPVEGIEVKLVSEENSSIKDVGLPTSISDKYGGYSFLISKSIMGGQRYAKLKFYDEQSRYSFKEDIFNIMSPQTVLLEKKKSSITTEEKPTSTYYPVEIELDGINVKIINVSSDGKKLIVEYKVYNNLNEPMRKIGLYSGDNGRYQTHINNEGDLYHSSMVKISDKSCSGNCKSITMSFAKKSWLKGKIEFDSVPSFPSIGLLQARFFFQKSSSSRIHQRDLVLRDLPIITN